MVTGLSKSCVRRATAPQRDESDDALQRPRIAAPVLEEHPPVGPPKDEAERERGHDRVIERPGDRDEVWDEIDWTYDVDQRKGARSASDVGIDPVEVIASWNVRSAARSAAPRLASHRVRMSTISSIPVR